MEPQSKMHVVSRFEMLLRLLIHRTAKQGGVPVVPLSIGRSGQRGDWGFVWLSSGEVQSLRKPEFTTPANKVTQDRVDAMGLAFRVARSQIHESAVNLSGS